MSNAWIVAVVGPRTLLGEALLEAIDDAAFPIRTVHLLDRGESVGQTLSLAGRDWEVGSVEAPPAGLQWAWVTDPDLMDDTDLARFAAAGVPLIDVTGAAPWSADLPAWGLTVPTGVSASEVPALLRCADTTTLMLAQLLQVLAPVLAPRSVDATLMLALSDAGQPAVQALGEETAALLSFRERPSGPLPVPVAFNVIPETGPLDRNGHSAAEGRLARDLPALLGLPTLDVRCTAVWVPVFYGHGIALSLRTQNLPDLVQIQAALAAAPAWVMHDSGAGRPTAVSDASGQGRLHLGRLRVVGGADPGLLLWMVADNQHLGGAAHAIRVAEILVRDYLSGIRQLVAQVKADY